MGAPTSWCPNVSRSGAAPVGAEAQTWHPEPRFAGLGTAGRGAEPRGHARAGARAHAFGLEPVAQVPHRTETGEAPYLRRGLLEGKGIARPIRATAREAVSKIVAKGAHP